jgi:hypothetical protein
MRSLLKIFQNFREQCIYENLSDSKNKAETLGIYTEFPKVRLENRNSYPEKLENMSFVT